MARRNGRNPKSPAYQWYPCDAAIDEHYQLMTFEERGVFHGLLDLAWLNDGIPAGLDKLARLLKVTLERIKAWWPALAPCWVPHKTVADRLVNPRQERERSSQAEHRANRKAASEAGNAAKRARTVTESVTHSDTVTVTESDTESGPPTIHYPLSTTPVCNARADQAAPSIKPLAPTDRPGRRLAQLALKPTLASDEALVAATAAWEEHQSDRGEKPWSARTWASNLSDWERWGPAVATKAILDTIRTGHGAPFIHKHGTEPPRPVGVAAPSGPPDSAEVYRKWTDQHQKLLDVPKPGGGTMKAWGLDKKYPGYDDAKKELASSSDTTLAPSTSNL